MLRWTLKNWKLWIELSGSLDVIAGCCVEVVCGMNPEITFAVVGLLEITFEHELTAEEPTV